MPSLSATDSARGLAAALQAAVTVRNDLAVTEAGFTSSQLQILLGNGDGTFESGDSYLSGDGPFYVQSAYLSNRKHNLDLMATTGSGV